MDWLYEKLASILICENGKHIKVLDKIFGIKFFPQICIWAREMTQMTGELSGVVPKGKSDVCVCVCVMFSSHRFYWHLWWGRDSWFRTILSFLHVFLPFTFRVLVTRIFFRLMILECWCSDGYLPVFNKRFFILFFSHTSVFLTNGVTYYLIQI